MLSVQFGTVYHETVFYKPNRTRPKDIAFAYKVGSL